MQSLIRRIILFVPQQKFFTNKDEEQESAKDLKLRNSRKPPPHTYPDDTKNCYSCSSSSSSSCFYDPSNPFATRQQGEEGGGEEEVWEDKNWGSDVSSWESFLSVLVHASSSVLDVLITQEPSLLSVFVRDTTDLLEDALNVVDLELSNNDCGGSGGAELNSQTKLSVTDGDVVRVYAYQKFCERCKIDDIILEIPNAGVLSQIIVKKHSSKIPKSSQSSLVFHRGTALEYVPKSHRTIRTQSGGRESHSGVSGSVHSTSGSCSRETST